MKYNIKLAFYRLESKENNKGLAPIYVRIKQQGAKIVNLSTGIWLLKTEFDKKKKKIKGSTPRTAAMAKQLRDFEDMIYNLVHDIEYDRIKATPEEIKYRLNKSEDQHTLLTLFNFHINDMKKREGRGERQDNIQRYMLTQDKIVDYLKLPPYRCTDIPLERLDYNFIVGFDAFMAKSYKNALSTRYKNTQRLRTVITTGVKLGWLVTTPFAGYKGKTAYRKRQYLTEQELQAIENLDLRANIKLDLIRDLFLFTCYTGISYVDLEALTPQNIASSETGKLFLRFDRSKTGIVCTPYLTDISRYIIEKYTNHPACLNTGRLLPVHSNQHLNRSLKKIADQAGIKKPMTCHIGRHTFATLALNFWGTPIETVSKLLGHKSIKTTMIYLQITEAKIEEDCLRMIEKVNNRSRRLHVV